MGASPTSRGLHDRLAQQFSSAAVAISLARRQRSIRARVACMRCFAHPPALLCTAAEAVIPRGLARGVAFGLALLARGADVARAQGGVAHVFGFTQGYINPA